LLLALNQPASFIIGHSQLAEANWNSSASASRPAASGEGSAGRASAGLSLIGRREYLLRTARTMRVAAATAAF
jgi:hypothetical protein